MAAVRSALALLRPFIIAVVTGCLAAKGMKTESAIFFHTALGKAGQA